MKTSINLNDYVYVRLSDHGRNLVRFGHTGVDQEDGSIKFAMWDLMRIFGPDMSVSSRPPFVDNSVEFEVKCDAERVSDGQYEIPDGMWQAFLKRETHLGPPWDQVALRRMLMAAVRWLAENPIQVSVSDLFPKEIEDLLFVGGIAKPDHVIGEMRRRDIDALIVEAYRRGLENGAKHGRP